MLLLSLFHINKIHQNDAGQIAESQLSGDLLRCFLIDLPDGFLFILSFDTFPGVDIDDSQRLCRFDNQICAGFQPYLRR